MSEQQTYSREHIQQYLQHKMSAAEMHAFEKAMMNDSFLEDAVEGYRHSNEDISAKHLDQIEHELAPGKSKARVVAMPFTKNAWWRIAAIVLVVFTCAMSYIILNNSATNNKQEIASTSSIEDVVRNDSVSAAGTPSSTTADATSLSPSHPLAKNNNAAGQVYNEPKANDDSTPANNNEMLALNERNRDQASSTSIMRANGKDAEVQQLESKDETAGRTPSTSAQAATSAPVLKETKLSQDRMNDLKTPSGTALQNERLAGRVASNTKPEDVVVVGYGKQKKASITGSVAAVDKGSVAPNSNAASAVSGTPGVAPRPGWQSFNDYVQKSMNNIKDTIGTHLPTREVVLEFYIDKQGKPKNIKIVKSANTADALQAIKILNEGPLWRSSSENVKTSYTFNFTR